MNADVDRTIWDEWLTHVDKSYQDGWFKNGFWIPETVIQTQNANECIHFFLKKVGGLKLKDLDAMARLFIGGQGESAKFAGGQSEPAIW